MKNMRFIGVLAAIMLIFAAVPVAHAETSASTQVAVAADAPVILPTNPFYFAKEFARDVRRFFTFGRVNKAAFELEVADQKALEVRELAKLSSSTEDIKKAMDNYQADVALLKVKIASLKDNANDPRVSKLLDDLADEAHRHAELFQSLKTNDDVKSSVEKVESAVEEVTKTAAALATPEEATKLEAAITPTEVIREASVETEVLTETKTAATETQTQTTTVPAVNEQVQTLSR